VFKFSKEKQLRYYPKFNILAQAHIKGMCELPLECQAHISNSTPTVSQLHR